MSGSVAEAPKAPAPPAEHATSWGKNRKLDQWIAFWSVPFFFNLFGLVFVPLSWMMPPRSPSASTAHVVDFMHSHNLLIACVILTLAYGLAAVSNACYLMQVRRMSGGPGVPFSMSIW